MTTDELFDYSENADKLRMDELEKLYMDTFYTGSLKDRLRISEQAVKEFPTDWNWLSRYGWVIWNEAVCLRSEEREAEREKAIGIFRTVIEHVGDSEGKSNAIGGIVDCLCDAGRKSEALEYLKKLPKADYYMTHYADLYIDCLEGEERKREIQRHVLKLFSELIEFLYQRWDWSFDTFTRQANDTALALMQFFFPNGDYQYYSHWLPLPYMRKLLMMIQDGKKEDAEDCLRKAYHYACYFDSIEGAYNYTSPLFNLVTERRERWCFTGEETKLEELKAWLSTNRYSAARELDTYQELFGDSAGSP